MAARRRAAVTQMPDSTWLTVLVSAVSLLIQIGVLVGVYVKIIERLTRVETNVDHLLRAKGVKVRAHDTMPGAERMKG